MKRSTCFVQFSSFVKEPDFLKMNVIDFSEIEPWGIRFDDLREGDEVKSFGESSRQFAP